MAPCSHRRPWRPFFIVTALFAANAALAQVSVAARVAEMRPQTGDKVAVRVFGDPAFSDVATLDEMGRIMLPRIGMIQASAMTIAALRDTVRARLSTILRDPAVEVSVMRRVIVSGEVVRPGVYYAELSSSMGEMVSQAAGLKETANPGKVYLVRGAERRRIENWEWSQAPEADLRSGDQIVVGRKSWLSLNIIPVAGTAMAMVSLAISLKGQF